MKKALAVLALALFIGGISVPAIASNHKAMNLISLRDDDPKKKADGEKTDKKAETTEASTKSHDCSSDKKAETSEKKTETAKPAASGGCG